MIAMSTAIEFNNISKLYRLGLVSTGTLAHDLKRWWTMNVRGKEDPYLTIGETNDRSIRGESDYVWALKDIDFKVEQGDIVGIIGKNGAGKSTLLKLLSKITTPTTGTIKAKGRIGSLLEVGTGFHPEMTGRENIYLNGAILGMTKQEITAKLDEIVDFSGCERYIDTPVKRYSSGMMVRLGFAVAAHLDPEILVVDEVLAVGDAEFQKKAIGKMQDVSRGEGRTVLFVSHNMASVRKLCSRGILLENGRIKQLGDVDSIVDSYLSGQQTETKIINAIQSIEGNLKISNIRINGTDLSRSIVKHGQTTLSFEIEGEAESVPNAEICLIFKNNNGEALALFSLSEDSDLLTLDGNFKINKEIILPPRLHHGLIKVDLHIHQPNVQYYLIANDCCLLDVEGYIPATGQIRSLNSGLITLLEKHN